MHISENVPPGYVQREHQRWSGSGYTVQVSEGSWPRVSLVSPCSFAHDVRSRSRPGRASG